MKLFFSVVLSCCLLAQNGCASVDLDSLRQQIRQEHAIPAGSPPQPAASAPPVAPPPPSPPATGKAPRVPRRAPPAAVERTPVAPPAIPRVPPPAVAPLQPAGPSAPAPVTACDADGCWSGGERYQGGGGAYLDRNGRPCQSNGGWIQCF